jgi:release factor glutamine methyltransferase
MALTDNSDGTSFYKRIISISKNLFQNSGYLYFELGKGQYKNISDLMIQEKFTDIQIIKDYAGIERIICGEIK